MHSFDPQLKQQNVEWRAPMSPRKKIARHSQGTLKVMHVTFFSRNGLVLDHPMPVGTTVNGRYYCSLLQHKVRKALCRKRQNCWSVVPFCSRTTQHLITIVMCKIWCNVGAGRCWHIFPTLQISPHVIIGCFHM
jgi:hypothetical protein